MNLLKSFDWPGNIRELENTVKHAFMQEETTRIGIETVKEAVRSVDYVPKFWRAC